MSGSLELWNEPWEESRRLLLRCELGLIAKSRPSFHMIGNCCGGVALRACLGCNLGVSVSQTRGRGFLRGGPERCATSLVLDSYSLLRPG